MAGALWDGYLSRGQRRAISRGLGVEPDAARALVVFWAGLHDLGKIIPAFQAMDKKAFAGLGYPQPGGRYLGHDEAVHAWLAATLEQLGYAPGGLRNHSPAVLVAQLLGGHHGRFQQVDMVSLCAPLIGVPELGAGVWEEQRRTVFETVHRVLGQPPAPPRLEPYAAALVCGVVILADWLASQEEFLLERLPGLPEEAGDQALAAHWAESVRLAPGLITGAGLDPVRLRGGSFEEEFSGFSPNELQRSVADHLPALLNGPGMLVVMAPMGLGKTETALHAARLMGEAAGASGLFVALPTMATADQMYTRVRRYAAERVEGEAALTLLHSMAWLSPAYADQEAVAEGTRPGGFVGGDGDRWARVVVTAWLRARKRGILASLAVGTIDQVLTSVLPVRHSVLRLLGLAGKVLVVDEAHAYDAYMQGLLCRTLTWLGHLGVPVVLLSATLPAPTARRLVRAYRVGAGHRGPVELPARYPGWWYVDGTSGKVTADPEPGIQLATRELTVTPHQVPVADGLVDRAAVLRELLDPLATQRGCALVVCTTVAEAQQTYRQLRDWYGQLPGPGPELRLLHARFPAWQRAEITDEVLAKFGKEPGHRPHAAILVATQVVEQSLDLDFDLVISDLAPVALLLQRAGRGHRHTRPLEDRGAYDEPRLAVLIPSDTTKKLSLPKAWKAVYDEALLVRTHQLLAAGPRLVNIPGDVQPLVDAVYDETFSAGTTEADTRRWADEQVMRQLSGQIAVPAPTNLDNLDPFSHTEVDEELVATRLGADSVRVLPCYQHPDGRRTLDHAGSIPLPTSRLNTDQLRTVLSHTIPVRAGRWSLRPGEHTHPPEAWEDNAWLRGLLLLPHQVDAAGQAQPVQVGDREFRLDVEEGLIG